MTRLRFFSCGSHHKYEVARKGARAWAKDRAGELRSSSSTSGERATLQTRVVEHEIDAIRARVAASAGSVATCQAERGHASSRGGGIVVAWGMARPTGVQALWANNRRRGPSWHRRFTDRRASL